jgi:hypothetical protein
MKTLGILVLAALPVLAATAQTGSLVRKLETINPAPYRLTLKAGIPGSLRITDPQRPGPGTTLDRPGSAAVVANPEANAGSVSTWPLEFRSPANGPWELELADDSGQVRMAFQVTVQSEEPRLKVTMAPGAYDSKNVYNGRGYYVKGPVTVVEETGDQDVLIWIGPSQE